MHGRMTINLGDFKFTGCMMFLDSASLSLKKSADTHVIGCRVPRNDDMLDLTPKTVLIGLHIETLMNSKGDVGLVSVAPLANVGPIQDVKGIDELEGTSLSDYILQARWDTATKEIEKVIEMGSKLEVQFISLVDEEGDRRNSGTKGEAHEALSTEKEFINGCFRENVLPKVLINESELVGGDPKGVSAVVDKKALKMNEQIGGEGFESQQIEDDRSALQKEVLKENMGMEINKPDEHSLDPNKELDPEVEFGLKPKTDLLEAEIKEGSKD
ncbi:hypothetical protein V6N12_060020 [Hibiscus sabdariffa]|uniref:Uncharacterized protein n=1 Tax=Hibiscus sabdariffa TaxID=183260 RepID=A0ABR2D373_9ROSI